MSTPRYVTLSSVEARSRGYDVEESSGTWFTDRSFDVLVDTKRLRLVWEDGHPAENPEDYYLFRRLKIFADELNRLAEEQSHE